MACGGAAVWALKRERERGLGEWRGGCGCYCSAEILSKRGERMREGPD
jgi:hypothetical protein